MNSILNGANVPELSILSQRIRYQASSSDATSVAASGYPGSALRAHEQMMAIRHERIAIAAYLMAEARGFAQGLDADDWLRAQANINAQDAGIYFF